MNWAFTLPCISSSVSLGNKTNCTLTCALPTFLEPVLFRIIQESLNNVAKHAQAGMVWVGLDLASPDAVTLSVRDDGVGFDPAILDDIVQRGRLGLKQMRERVENLAGTFELRSEPGSGAEIQVVLPLAGRREE